MTKLVKTASALAIAMTALTAMTALATDASAKITKPHGPHPRQVHVSPLIAQALRNHPNLLTQQLGKTGGGQVISCHPNTGCSISGGPTHHHPYGGWHRHEQHRWSWEHNRHEHRYGYGYGYGHGYPVEVAGSYEGPTCEAPFKWRMQMVRHGFHHVFKKVCVEAL